MITTNKRVILSALIALGLSFLFSMKASSQTLGPVRVISLSKSGYEQANSVTFSANGKYLAVGGTSGVYLFDAVQLSEVNFIKTGAWARSVAFVPGTDTLAAGLHDATINFWSIPGIQLEKTLDGPQGWVRSISFSSDGSLLASASDDDHLRIWNVKAFLLVKDIKTEISGIRAVALSPDGSLAAGALGDKTVRVWSVADGKLLYTLRGHEDWVRCLAFSPDGKLLASGSFDRKILLWNMSDGNLVRTLSGHTSSVLSLAYTPDGKTLASGSVDQTIHLWHVEDGKTFRVLQGHSGFVYAVAFSPDGITLASGGADNTVRLWDMTILGKTSPDAPTTSPATPSDCRACHHRRGLAEPPRIIALNCEGCHATGIGLSWCTGFARSPSAQSGPVHVTPVNDPSGVPVNSRDLAVVIAAPGNGETFYVRGSYMVPEQVSGKVFYSDHQNIGKIVVHLDIISDGKITSSLVTHPSDNGTFIFNLALNAASPPPFLSRPGTRQCLVCHGDYMPEGEIPRGDIRVMVTASSLEGQIATDDRWVHVDSSHEGTLPVKVVDAETNRSLPGISVEARTLLYQWRDRFGGARTNLEGNGLMKVDALSMKPTTYSISITPQVVNGLLYASQAPIEVVLDPNLTTYPDVVLEASALSGHIMGNLSTGEQFTSDMFSDAKVWAIQLPYGPFYQTPIGSDGGFSFSHIPVSHYLVVPDPWALVEKKLTAAVSQADLLITPVSNLTVALSAGRPLVGKIATNNDGFLPFAYVRSGADELVLAADPVSGNYLIPDLVGHNYVTVTAPGYYSLPQSVLASQQSLNFVLTPRPEIQQISWGSGYVTVPPETITSITGLDFRLESGWLWGDADTSAQPVSIHLSRLDIKVEQGKFALEIPVLGKGWLYLFKGKAVLTYAGMQGVEVSGGQMIALSESAVPLSLDPVVISALHPLEKNPVLIEIIEPTLSARIRSLLVKTGIGAMQMITFITYILSLVTLIAIPLIGLFWYKKLHNEKTNRQE